ncbi:MAG: hypothetical protein QOF18_988, partial [Frankiaceae bacterium]|nr:hypothetical protein [Frankiaceae bacterium]
GIGAGYVLIAALYAATERPAPGGVSAVPAVPAR